MYFFKGKIPKEVSYQLKDFRFLGDGGMGKFAVHWSEMYNNENSNNDFKITNIERQIVTVLTYGGKKPRNAKNVVTTPNEVLSRLQVVGIDNQSDKYAILLPNGYVVREEQDVVLDAMLNLGINKDGIIDGEYIWAKVPGGMKLVRLGSDLHKALLDYEERSRKGAIDTKTMIPGQLYRTVDGNQAIFCGFINTYTSRVRIHPDDKEGFGANWSSKKNPAWRFDVQFNKADLATLWFEIWIWNEITPTNCDSIVQDIQKSFDGARHVFQFKTLKKHSYSEKIEGIKIEIPDNIISEIRRKTIQDFNDCLKMENDWFADQNNTRLRRSYDSRLGKSIPWPDYKGVNYNVATYLRKGCSSLCMMPFGMKSIIPHELDIFKPFLATEDNEISKAIMAHKAKSK